MTAPTASTQERFPATEAAQGARRAKLAEIDLFYQQIRDDIAAERAHAIARSIAASLERIREITTGVEVDDNGNLIGYELRRHIVARKLLTEAHDVNQERGGIEFRYHIANDANEEARLAERHPYDFGMEGAA